MDRLSLLEQRETNLMVAVSILRTAVDCLLSSAHPNEKEHSRRFEEWRLAWIALEEAQKWINL